MLDAIFDGAVDIEYLYQRSVFCDCDKKAGNRFKYYVFLVNYYYSMMSTHSTRRC